MKNFINFCINQHDIVCNQKYDDTLPYSFHLGLVAKQVEKFKFILKPEEHELVIMGAFGHDLIEDARTTYNDIKQFKFWKNTGYDSRDSYFKPELADIIYACTELRGHNRSERHGAEYLQGLKECRLGLFVKLCDISANVGYGILTNSSMVDKYRKEIPHLKEQLYTEEFKPLWDNIENLLKLT
jgi:hypothetical protein